MRIKIGTNQSVQMAEVFNKMDNKRFQSNLDYPDGRARGRLEVFLLVFLVDK